MKLKYYLRGLGVGILLSTAVLSISFRISEKRENDNADAAKNQQESAALDNSEIAIEDLLTHSKESKAYEESEVAAETKTLEESEAAAETKTLEASETAAETKAVEESKSVTETKAVEETKAIQETKTPENETEVQTTVEERNEVVVEIKKGMNSEDVSRLLEKNGLIQDSNDFNRYLKKNGYSTIIDVGRFTIAKNSTYEQIVDIIIK